MEPLEEGQAEHCREEHSKSLLHEELRGDEGCERNECAEEIDREAQERRYANLVARARDHNLFGFLRRTGRRERGGEKQRKCETETVRETAREKVSGREKKKERETEKE
jgi:hypothetical protein